MRINSNEVLLGIYTEMLSVMENAFRDFEGEIPPAKRVKQKNGWVFRFEQKDIETTLVLKLAHILSTLNAAMVLLRNGYVAQQAMLQRVIDEANEDVLFLVVAVTNGERTPLHDRYLESFWAEEFSDLDDIVAGHQSRAMIPRQKIRAFNSRLDGPESDRSRGDKVTKVLAKVYSGFIHGAAPHILESYGGHPPRFHLHGMTGTPRISELTRDLWNYMYRGLMSHVLVALALGSETHVKALEGEKLRFETLMGLKY